MQKVSNKRDLFLENIRLWLFTFEIILFKLMRQDIFYLKIFFLIKTNVISSNQPKSIVKINILKK